MFSKATIAALTEWGFDYIRDARKCRTMTIRKAVLKSENSLVPLHIVHKHGETQRFIKQVMVDGGKALKDGARGEVVVLRPREVLQNDDQAGDEDVSFALRDDGTYPRIVLEASRN